MSEPQQVKEKEEFLDSLANGLALLRAFGRQRTSFSVKDGAEFLGVTRAASRRILLTLLKLGYVAQNGRDFFVTPKVLELGYAYFSTLDLPSLAKPMMEEVSRQIGETCSLGVLDRTDIVFIARVEAPYLLRLDLSIGSRLPAYPHSMGRVLLSGLDDAGLDVYFREAKLEKLTRHTVTSVPKLRQIVRQAAEDGYCIAVSELVEGLAGVAVPIRDANDRVIAGMSVSMILGSRTEAKLRKDYLPPLQQAARKVSAALTRG